MSGFFYFVITRGKSFQSLAQYLYFCTPSAFAKSLGEIDGIVQAVRGLDSYPPKADRGSIKGGIAQAVRALDS